MASSFQAIKHEPGYEQGQPSIGMVDLEPFLIENNVKTESKPAKTKPVTTKGSSAFDEADEAKYRDPNVDKIKFGCRFCPIMYQSKRQLTGHVRKIHHDLSTADQTIYEKCCQPIDNAVFHCKVCDNKQDFSYLEFKRHVYKIHESKKTCMECPVCHGFFANSQALKKHEAKKHPDANLAGNINLPKPVTCEFCLLEFSELRSLKHHKYSKHNDRVKEAPPVRVDRPRDCELCGKHMRNSNSLWSHKRNTHHIELNLPRSRILKSNHQCPKCSMKFKWFSNLSRHRRQVHENVQYTCKLCKKSFGTRQAIYSHSFTHTKLVRYNCTEADCQYRTMLKKKYIEHLKEAHQVVDFDQVKHDPDRQKFSYKKVIDNYCQSVSERSESDSDSEEEFDSDET